MRILTVCIVVIFAVVGACLTSDSAPRQAAAATRESILYSFGGPNGAGPLFGVVGDAGRDMYGAAVFGGRKDRGVIFELARNDTGFSERLLYRFLGVADGEKPDGLTRTASGDLFGFTAIGGSGSGGTVFDLKPSGVGFTLTTLYSFGPAFYAGGPIGDPVINKLGVIYGVTQFGGAHNSGIVFKLTPTSNGYTFTDFYDFPGGDGGELPQAGLTIASDGTVYGTTYYGGNVVSCSGGCGEVFTILPGSGGVNESVLYRFSGYADGTNPYGALTVDDATGDLYGTTEYGGAGNGCGTTFKLSPSPTGYIHTILHSFSGSDGCLPEGKVFIGDKGIIVGTTALGGRGFGLVYKLVPAGGTYIYRALHVFIRPTNGTFDGAEPEQTTLIEDANGALYGTTRSGGSQTQCDDGGPGGHLGCGTVFKIMP